MIGSIWPTSVSSANHDVMNRTLSTSAIWHVLIRPSAQTQRYCYNNGDYLYNAFPHTCSKRIDTNYYYSVGPRITYTFLSFLSLFPRNNYNNNTLRKHIQPGCLLSAQRLAYWQYLSLYGFKYPNSPWWASKIFVYTLCTFKKILCRYPSQDSNPWPHGPQSNALTTRTPRP